MSSGSDVYLFSMDVSNNKIVDGFVLHTLSFQYPKKYKSIEFRYWEHNVNLTRFSSTNR